MSTGYGKGLHMGVNCYKFYNGIYGQDPSQRQKMLEQDQHFQWQGETCELLRDTSGLIALRHPKGPEG